MNSENFNKEIGNIKKNQPELKNATAEVKNTLEGINRSAGAEDGISDPEDGGAANTQSEQQNENF